MKVAIVHDYLFQFGGAEKCVEKWLEMYPQSDLYTSFFISSKFADSKAIQLAKSENRIKTSFLQGLFRFSFWQKLQKHLFFIYPLVFSLSKVSGYDLVIISSTFCAKNVRLSDNEKVVYYCYTPTRFLHQLIGSEDQASINPILVILIPIFTFWLKFLDLRAVKYLNKKNTIWLTISSFVQQNVERIYHAKSQVVYPPVEVDQFLPIVRNAQDFYLYFGRISFHKRLDLVIKACLLLNKKLKIAGSSSFLPEMNQLKKIVTDEEFLHPEKKGLIEFLGRVSDVERDELLAGCKAFIFPTKEDFGIVSIEAFASGVPVIAYQAGGALEYLKPDINGVFFEKQEVESLKNAILDFETKVWDEKTIKQTSVQFNSKTFEQCFRSVADFDFPIFIVGKVVNGAKRGRTIGFPTANLDVKVDKISTGIYASFAYLNGEKLPSVSYIGKNETFAEHALRLEVHIFDFDKDIYNQDLKVELIHFIRGDQKFESQEILVEQIARDCESAKNFIKNLTTESKN